jgi:hypothetical protein
MDIIGGHDVDGTILSSAHIHNPNSHTYSWSTATPLPIERQRAASASINSKIYLIGGEDTSGLTNEVGIYDPASDTWSLGPDLPVLVYDPAAQVVGNVIYLIGGASGNNGLSTVFALNPGASEQEPNLHVLLDVNEQAQLSVSKKLPDNLGLIWTSSDESVATVNASGIVTGVGEGNCRIWAESHDGKFREYIPVKVIEHAEEYRLALHLNVGETKRLWFGDDPAAVLWTSMDPSVVTVDNTGRLRSVSPGLAIIMAEFSGVEQYIYVRAS